MNSFSTSDDTKTYLNKEHSDLMAEEDVELVQNKSPKVDAKTMEPIKWPANPDMEWYAACLIQRTPDQCKCTDAKAERKRIHNVATAVATSD